MKRKRKLLQKKVTCYEKKKQWSIIDIFVVDLISQLWEMNSRFKENEAELLVLSSTLDPREGYISFRVDDICKLANKFYLKDFIK